MSSVHAAAPWDEVLAFGTPPAGGQVVARRTVPGRTARFADMPDWIDPRLAASLAAAGVDRLYTHQADTAEAARTGDAMVVTGTASGKSLAFNLPVLNAIAEDAGTRAMYLYPTKALAQDQARSLSALSPPDLRLAIYDGDTPQAERRQVRGWANLILTNPDMLHTGILPAHGIWAESLHRLRYVVVDEAHVYRGVFGSHVANVLARLRRICEHYGSQPAFILASATIANPGAAGSTLAGRPGRGDRGRRGAGSGPRGRRLEPAPARPRVRHPRRARWARRRRCSPGWSPAASGRSCSSARARAASWSTGTPARD